MRSRHALRSLAFASVLAPLVSLAACTAPAGEATGTSNDALNVPGDERRWCFDQTGFCMGYGTGESLHGGDAGLDVLSTGAAEIAKLYIAVGRDAYAAENHKDVASVQYFDAIQKGILILGYPLSRAYVGTSEGNDAVIQWFERERIEYHFGNSPFAGKVLTGRLGADLMASVNAQVTDMKTKLAYQGGKGPDPEHPDPYAVDVPLMVSATRPYCAVYRRSIMDTDTFFSVCGTTATTPEFVKGVQWNCSLTSCFPSADIIVQPNFLSQMRRDGGDAFAPPDALGYGKDDTYRRTYGLPISQAINVGSSTRKNCEASIALDRDDRSSITFPRAIADHKSDLVSDDCKVLFADPTLLTTGEAYATTRNMNDPRAVSWVQLFERRLIEYHPGEAEGRRFQYNRLGVRVLEIQKKEVLAQNPGALTRER